MARTSTRKAARPSQAKRVPAQAETGAAPSGFDQVLVVNAQWARDALNASLLHTQGLFTLLQAIQQAQARMLHDASADVENAIEALQTADDGSALAAVPGRLMNAQWQHTLENVGNTAGRLMEIESAWLQQAQSQAAQQFAAVSAGASDTAPMSLPVQPTADAAQAWQQWAERWQSGVGEMSRAWSEAVRAAQARA